jgi:Abortive infection C-terminus
MLDAYRVERTEIAMANAPLSDAIIVAISQLVDDAQSERREPSHSDLEFQINRAGLAAGDPKAGGQTVGKAKRVRAVLSWAIEHKFEAGQEFVASLVSVIRGHGGFRESSPNFVGTEVVTNATALFASEGYELSSDGELRPRLLDNLNGSALTEALQVYIRRAKRGAIDAALVTGTGKDLLEAVAGHILHQRYGSYQATANFPTLLGQVFLELGLATPASPASPGEPAKKNVERAMYELACAINRLRNSQGTGHGRPWLPTVTQAEAQMALECMGVITERLLSLHQGIK